MNVTHFIPYMHPRSGGPPVVVDRHCRQLVARGWNCRVVTTDSLARGEDRGWLDQYRDGYAIDVHPSRGPASFAYSPELGRAVDRVVADSDLVHVHTVWTYTNWAAIRACRRRGVPLVVMPHGMLDPHSLGRKWLKKQLYGRLCEWPNLRTAAGMIYTHDDERRLAESTVSGLPPGHIVPLAADDPPAAREALAEEFLAARPDLRGRRIIVFLGRLHSKKGLDLLIPAMALVVAQQPNAHLLLVGAGAPDYEATLRHWIAAHDLADHVTLAGTLSGRAKWSALAAAEVLALPSYQENFALVVVEALRIGTPVMLSRRVNISAEVTAAGAGDACELNPESVADTALKFLANESFARAAAKRGEQLAREKFNWSASADALEAAYRSVLERSQVQSTKCK